jgi:hypothetical protein
MSKHTYFVYISLLVLFACGDEITTETTQATGGNQGASGPALSQDGKLSLPPCDQIASGDQSACETSIYNLKNMTAVPDDSRVAIVGVVAGLRLNADNEYSHLILTTPTNDANYAGADFSAVWIYLNNSDIDTIGQQPPPVGSYIQIIGAVKTHYGQRQLEKVEQVVNLTSVASAPQVIDVQSTDIALNGPRAWGLEGSLVRISNIEVTNASPTPGPGDGIDGIPTYEFEVTGGLLINDFIYTGLPQPVNGD